MTVWERFADAVLRREAALCRLVAGVPPRDHAGLYVDDDELDRILRTLPGLDGPAPELAAHVRSRFDPVVAAARTDLEAARVGPRRRGADPWAGLVREAGLDAAACEVLALLAAVEVHPQRQRVVAYVQDSVRLPRLTHATLARVLGPTHVGVRAVAPGSALDRAALVAVDATGPWAVRQCGVEERVVWALLGHDALDPALPVGAGVRAALTPAGARVPGGPVPLLVLLHGADPESRRDLAAHLDRARPLLVTPVPAAAQEWAALVREATVRGAVVVLEVVGPLDGAAAHALERASHLSFVVSSPRELPLECLPERPWLEMQVQDGEAGAADWLARTGAVPGGGHGPPRLSREQLRLVARATGGDPDRVPAGVRRLAGGHLDGLAARVHATRGWDDLVLPAPQQGQLRELVARYRRRRTVFTDWGFPSVPSAGVVALFSGPSGTGKTLAAEVAATELGLDLYKVDLSAVVSKYIGETEKNLERIFTSAAAGDLVLFFDEADALFGKRSEVQSSHDRYANIEVAYLLQRLEQFDGLVVLATNLQRNIDDAFLRRIAVAVAFAAPDEEHRRRIWSLVFPPAAPVVDLDLDFLARQFKITGGVIRSAALGAAFSAADDGGAITMERVVLALQREFVKLGHLSTESEFARYFDVVSSRR